MKRPALRFERTASAVAARRRRGNVFLHLAAAPPVSSERKARKSTPARRTGGRMPKVPAGKGRGHRRSGGSWVRSAIGFLVFVEVLLLGGHAFRWVRTSGVFSLEEVIVVGHRTLAPGALVRRAGFSPEGNLLEVGLEEARRRIEEHPWVRRASVRRRLPHVLRVEIEERVPLALLRREGGLGVDREGVVLGGAEAPPGSCLPLLEDFRKVQVRPGETVGGAGFEAAIAAAALFSEIPSLRKSCMSVRLLKRGRIRIRSLDRKVSLLVDGRDMEAQATRFRGIANRLFRHQRGRSAGRLELDLTFPGRIVVRPQDQNGGLKG